MSSRTVLRTLFVFVLLVLAGSAVFAQDTSINVGDTITAETTEADVNYTINLEAGQTVTIDLQSLDFDTYIRVLDSNGVQVDFDDDGGDGFNSLLNFTAEASDTYTIVVTAFSGAPTGSYTLSVTAGEATTTTTTTTTDTVGGPINVGDSVTATANDERVEYTISLEADQTVTISTVGSGFDTVVEVFDSTGAMIASDDDSGGNLTSQLDFTAPASGTYTILVRAFASDNANGTFTLSITAAGSSDGDGGGGLLGNLGQGDGDDSSTQAGGTELSYGTTITANPDGAVTTTFTFEGAAGDVINLYVVSQGDEDSRLFLFDSNNLEIAEDDDSGEGLNPYLRRFPLPADGTYTVEVQGFGESELLEPFDITLEQTELLDLSSGTVSVTLSEELDQEVLSLDITTGTRYIVTISASEELESSVFGEIREPGESFASTRFSVSGTNEFAFVYSAETSGRARVEVEYFAFSDPVTFEITVEPLN